MAKRGLSKEPQEIDFEDDQELLKLDEVIPMFVWFRLKDQIQQLPWEKASTACSSSQPIPRSEATRLYEQLLREMRLYIERESRLPGEISKCNAVQMKMEKRKIMEKHGNDPVAFVEAVADTLQSFQYLRPASASSQPSQKGLSLEAMASEEISPSSLEEIVQLTVETKNYMVNFIRHEMCRGLAEGEIVQRTAKAFQGAFTNLGKIVSMCEEFLKSLEKNIDEWRKAEVLYSAQIGPETEFEEQPFSRFVIVLNSLMEWFSRPQNSPSAAMNSPQSHHPEQGLLTQLFPAEMDQLQPQGAMCPQTALIENQLKRIEEAYLKTTLIVSQQPPPLVCMEVEENQNDCQTSEELPAGQTGQSRPTSSRSVETSDKEGSEKRYSSKKEQNFDVKIRFPGGNVFTHLLLTDPKLEYVSESELAAAAAEAQGSKDVWTQPVAEMGENYRSLSWTDHLLSEVNEIEFKDLRVTNYRHLKSNKVYLKCAEFVRVRFSANVHTRSGEYKVQVLSLPFVVTTDASRQVMCSGIRLWYYGSSPNMYCGNFEIKEELPEEDVLDLLDKCVRNVDSKGRNLEIEEKEYLSKLLPKNGNGNVKLQDFVLKPSVPSQKPDLIESMPPREPEFPFYTWFHAVINTIRTVWRKPWLDGTIFGLISKEYAHSLIYPKSVANGVTVLRISSSCSKNASATNALAGLTMHAKYIAKDASTGKKETEFVIARLPPCLLEANGLYKSLKRVYAEANGSQIFFVEYLKGRGIQEKVEYLKKYQTDSEAVINLEYCGTLSELHQCLKVTPVRLPKKKDGHKKKRCSGGAKAVSSPATLKGCASSDSKGFLCNGHNSSSFAPHPHPTDQTSVSEADGKALAMFSGDHIDISAIKQTKTKSHITPTVCDTWTPADKQKEGSFPVSFNDPRRPCSSGTTSEMDQSQTSNVPNILGEAGNPTCLYQVSTANAEVIPSHVQSHNNECLTLCPDMWPNMQLPEAKFNQEGLINDTFWPSDFTRYETPNQPINFAEQRQHMLEQQFWSLHLPQQQGTPQEQILAEHLFQRLMSAHVQEEASVPPFNFDVTEREAFQEMPHNEQTIPIDSGYQESPSPKTTDSVPFNRTGQSM